jgi:hypothetical protein
MATKASSTSQPSKVLSVKDAAAYIGVSVWTLRHKAGIEIPYVQYGEATSPMKFLISDLDAYIARHRVQP